ncbi:PREDICTED: uncharacterized protein LOC109341982 [Lupinus angustifolius]|uniref:uncharacterized protein LOC109341982 n=1 Tax=Lupinus angustifolius TaxID=3871 RepID=UPI00092F7C80|nr:PREDICTED: uncharacterized protein LOC109341982 [Lupinus angustifolius]
MEHVFLLALVIAFWEASPVVTGTSTVSINVLNYLRGDLNLTVHCKSQDGDLGVHVLPVYGRYQLYTNVIKSALFSCDLSMRDGTIVYDLYRYERDHIRCPTQCIWDVKTEGLVGLSEDAAQSEIFVNWRRRAN